MIYGLIFLCLHDLSGGAAVWIGAQHAQYQVHQAADLFQPPAYENNGFRQSAKSTPDGVDVVVEVNNQPLRSKIDGRRPKPLPQSLRALEERLESSSKQLLAEQIAVIFHWLRNEIEYKEEQQSEQSVTAVLERGSGNCVGLSSLAIFLLDRIGVKARYVTGIAYKRDDQVRLKLKGNVLHRWIEIYYDDVGWVFSDPSGKVNYVEATYLVFGIESQHDIKPILKQAVGADIELMGFQNGFRRVTNRRDLDGRLGIRPNILSVLNP